MALSRALEVAIIADATKFKRGMDDADKASGRFSKGLGGVAKRIGPLVGATVGIGALVTGFKSVVGAAKEAQESQARMETALKAAGISYKDHATQIDTVIQRTSMLAGLDDEELQNAFTNVARATGDVNKSLKDTALIADIARGAHVSLDSATRAVTNAELGRSTGLRKLGVMVSPITEAQDKWKMQYDMLKEGLQGLTGAELMNQKARVEAFEATKDFAKAKDKEATSTEALRLATEKYSGAAKAYGETAAGSQERLSVAFENLQEKIGAKVLPILAKLTEKLVDLIAWTERNWPRFQRAFDQAADHVEDAYQKIKPIIDNIRRVIEGLVDVVVGIIQGDWARAWDGLGDIAIGALKALANFDKLVGELFLRAARALADKVLEGMEAGLKGLGSLMLDALTGLGRIITGQNGTVNGWGRDIGKWLLDATVAALVGLGNAAWAEVQKIGAQITGGLSTVAGWGTSIGTKIKDSTVAALVGIGTAAWNIIDNIGSTIAGKAADIIAWGTGLGTKVKNGAVTGVTGIATAVWDIVNNIGSVIAGFAGAITEWGTGVGNKVKSGAVAGVTGIANVVWDIVNNIGSTIAGFAGAITDWGSGIGSKIKSGAIDGITGIATSVWHIIDNIPTVIAGFANTIEGWGRSVVVHIKDGIVDAGDELWNGIKHIFSGLPGKVKDLLGIGSPSKVFMDIGHDVVRGFVKGIENKAGDLKTAALGLVTGPIGAAVGAVGGVVGGVFGGGGASSNASQPDNVRLGQQMAAARGWTGAQWNALYNLFVGESGWNQYAYNDDSGATGIPQALPYSKMPRAAWLPAQGGSADPRAQIAWGLEYIANRYGSPLNAYSAWLSRSPHWYGSGGEGIVSGRTIIGVGERGPEHVKITPVSQMGRGGGGATIVVNINGNVIGGRKEDIAAYLADAVGDALEERDRRRTGGQILNGTPTLR